MHSCRVVGAVVVALMTGLLLVACSETSAERATGSQSPSSSPIAQSSSARVASAGDSCGTVEFKGQPGEVMVVQGTIDCDAAQKLIAGAFDSMLTKQLNGTQDYLGWQCGMVGPDPETSSAPYDYHCVSADRLTIVAHDVPSSFDPVSPAPAADGTPADCGPAPEFPNLTVATSGELMCQDAVALVSRYASDPRTQRGDRGAQVDEWACNILGATEAERAGHVIICARSDGAVVTVGPTAGQGGTPSGASELCTARVEGTDGVLTIVGGALTCVDAQEIVAERNGQIGYFNRPNGTAWACGSGDNLGAYECYSTGGPERFVWEPAT